MILQNPEFSKKEINETLRASKETLKYEEQLSPQELLNKGRDALGEAVRLEHQENNKLDRLVNLIGADEFFGRVIEAPEANDAVVSEGHLGTAAAIMEIADSGFVSADDTIHLEGLARWHVNTADGIINNLESPSVNVVNELVIMQEDLNARDVGHTDRPTHFGADLLAASRSQ